MKVEKFKYIVFGISIILSVFMASSFITSVIGILGIVYLIFLIYTRYNPIKGSMMALSIWGGTQWILMDISVSGIPLSQLSMFILVPIILLAIISRRKLILTKRFDKSTIAYICLTIWSILSIVIAPSIRNASELYLKIFIGMLILILFTGGICDKEENEVISNVIIKFGAISGIITSLQVLLYNIGISKIGSVNLVIAYYGGAIRPSGLFGGPVASAIVLYMTYIIAIYKQNSRNSIINKVYIICILLGIISTQTRTVIIAIVLSYLLRFLLFKRNKKIVRSVIYVSIISIAILILFKEQLYDFIIVRFSDIINARSIDDLGAGRFGIWKSIISGLMIDSSLVNIFIGNGIDAARYFVEKYSVFRIMDATHNDYLDMFVSSGIVGLVLFVYFLINIFNKVYKCNDFNIKSNILTNLIAYYMIVLNLSNTNYSAGPRWFFLIGISYIINKVNFINKLKNKEIGV